jgi:hypothetical protein
MKRDFQTKADDVRDGYRPLTLEVAVTLILLICGTLSVLPFVYDDGAVENTAAHAEEQRVFSSNPPSSSASSVPTQSEPSSAPSVSVAPAPAVDFSDAMDERTALLGRTLVLRLHGNGKVLTTWGIALKDRPAWIVFAVDADGKGRAEVDLNRVRQEFIGYPLQNIPEPKSCTVLSSWVDLMGVTRLQTDCIAQEGFSYDSAKLASLVKQALESGVSEVDVDLMPEHATMNTSSIDPALPPLTLLATGKSNFKGSGEGRKANVRKGLSEHLNNVFVPAGAQFSFNSVLGQGVTTQNGWHMALTIFEGTNLRPAPGGGICQVSTTFYRAALLAGLPIIEQKNHSLYVSYYEAYGVGQDATVFPGKQDLVVQNDTGGPLIIQAFYQGDDAFVNIFGVEDGRSVVLAGPYLLKTAPSDLRVNGRPIKANEIVWQRRVTKGSESRKETILAKYQAIPRSLSDRWKPAITESIHSVAVGSGAMIAGR